MTMILLIVQNDTSEQELRAEKRLRNMLDTHSVTVLQNTFPKTVREKKTKGLPQRKAGKVGDYRERTGDIGGEKCLLVKEWC